MTLGQATCKAIQLFERMTKGTKYDFRVAEPYEFSGNERDCDSALIHIQFAIDGDYSFSDINPFMVKVWKNEFGKIEACAWGK